MEGDEQLFGSLPGNPVSSVLTVQPPLGDQKGYVRLHVFMAARRDPMHIIIDDIEPHGMGEAIGALLPITMASAWANTSRIRRMMWAVWRKWGEDGHPVGIKGCGTEKR